MPTQTIIFEESEYTENGEAIIEQVKIHQPAATTSNNYNECSFFLPAQQQLSLPSQDAGISPLRPLGS